MYLQPVLNPKRYDGEREEWRTRHSRDRKKKKGDVGVEMVREKEGAEGEKMEFFLCNLHEFLTSSLAATPVVVTPAVVPTDRFHFISFVPANASSSPSSSS